MYLFVHKVRILFTLNKISLILITFEINHQNNRNLDQMPKRNRKAQQIHKMMPIATHRPSPKRIPKTQRTKTRQMRRTSKLKMKTRARTTTKTRTRRYLKDPTSHLSRPFGHCPHSSSLWRQRCYSFTYTRSSVSTVSPFKSTLGAEVNHGHRR